MISPVPFALVHASWDEVATTKVRLGCVLKEQFSGNENGRGGARLRHASLRGKGIEAEGLNEKQ